MVRSTIWLHDQMAAPLPCNSRRDKTYVVRQKPNQAKLKSQGPRWISWMCVCVCVINRCFAVREKVCSIDVDLDLPWSKIQIDFGLMLASRASHSINDSFFFFFSNKNSLWATPGNKFAKHTSAQENKASQNVSCDLLVERVRSSRLAQQCSNLKRMRIGPPDAGQSVEGGDQKKKLHQANTTKHLETVDQQQLDFYGTCLM